MKKRLLSLLLVFCMVFTMMPVGAFATEGTTPIGASSIEDATLCEHHPEHTTECGYTEGTDELPCNHEHDGNCGFVLAVEAILQTEEIPCDKECVDTDKDSIIDHAEDCAYTPAVEEISAVEGVPCSHVLDEHDENCGYAPAGEGTACEFVCEECEKALEQPALLGLTRSSAQTETADFAYGDSSAALALLNGSKTGEEDSIWDSSTKTLTLKGINFNTTAWAAVWLPDGSTIVLADGTTNTIASTQTAGHSSYGIYTQGQGTLTIRGAGTLNATGGDATEGGGSGSPETSGVYVETGSITFSEGTLNATGGTAEGSFGVVAADSVTVQSGTLNATGGTSTNSDSSDSYGVFGGKSITINGGTVTATGGNSAMFQAATLTNGAAVLTASTNIDGSAPVTYSADNIGSYKYLKVGTPPTSYNVWVGSTQVTSANAGGITGAGITGTVTYDAATNTLTLDNATITHEAGFYVNSPSYSAGINFAESGTIHLIGTNSINLSEGSVSTWRIYNINTTAPLKISGSGSLAMTAGNAPGSTSDSACVSLYAPSGTLTIDGATVTMVNNQIATTNRYGIFDWNIPSPKLELTNAAKLSIDTNGKGYMNNAGSGKLVMSDDSTTLFVGGIFAGGFPQWGNAIPKSANLRYTVSANTDGSNSTTGACSGDYSFGNNKYVKISPDLSAPTNYGDFSVSVVSGDTAPSFADGVLTFGAGGEYTVAMKKDVASTWHRIVVNASGVTLNLDGITISAPQGAENSAGLTPLTVTDATVLNVTADTSLTGGVGGSNGDGGAGIKGNIVVKGSRTLTAKGGSGNGSGKAQGSGIVGTVDVSGSVTLIAKTGIGNAPSIYAVADNDGNPGTINVAEGFRIVANTNADGLGLDAPYESLTGCTYPYVKVTPPIVRSFDISKGDITVENSSATGKLKVSYTDATNTAKVEDNIDPAEMLTVTGTTTSYKVAVDAGTTAAPVNITLDGVNIQLTADYTCAFELQGTANLTLTGTNVLKSGQNKAGLQVPSGASLTVIEDSTGNLSATGGSKGAGIGGDSDAIGGTVTINGGDVTATGGQYGAGIGGGYRGVPGASIILEINDGNVTAIGGEQGAGIGGGTSGAGGTITINGGNVKATGGVSAENIGKGQGGATSGTLKNTAGTDVYLATFTEPTDNKGKAFAITKAGGASYNYDLSKATAIDGTWYVYLPLGAAEATYDGKTYFTTVNNDHLSVFAKLPRVHAYLADNPATAGTDYVLNTTDKTLHIKTAKGAAFWSASGDNYIDYNVYLDSDIDVSAFLWSPVGGGTMFSGMLDGQGYSISGLTIDSTENYAGLLKSAGGARIQNLCIASGSVKSTFAGTSDLYVGGITGYARASIIRNCCNHAAVSGNHTGTSTSTDKANVGGIAGYANHDTTKKGVSNCYNTGSVTATAAGEGSYVGGIAGQTTYGTPTDNCYNSGTVSAFGSAATKSAGAILGYGATITNCYSLTDCVTAGTGGQNGTVLTSEQMKAATGAPSALIDKLNGWVTTAASTEYHTWVADATDNPINGGYPVFGEKWSAPHSHCVCGGTTNVGDHTSHANVTLTPWNGTDALDFNTAPDGVVSVYLTANKNRSEDVVIPEDKTLNLCLNGKTLSGGIESVLQNNGTLNLCDCQDGGKIQIENEIAIANLGAFTMYGGTITGSSMGIKNFAEKDATPIKLCAYRYDTAKTGNHRLVVMAKLVEDNTQAPNVTVNPNPQRP